MKRNDTRQLLMITLGIVLLLAITYWGSLLDQKKNQATTNSTSLSTLAEVTNSGSTNFAGWNLTIYSDGSGRLVCDSGPQLHKACTSKTYGSSTFPAALKKDLANTRLSGYTSDCMSSVSFGSVDTLKYGNMRTSGIDCYAQTEHTPLAKDLDAVLAKVSAQT